MIDRLKLTISISHGVGESFRSKDKVNNSWLAVVVICPLQGKFYLHYPECPL